MRATILIFRAAECCIRMYVNNSIFITIIFVRYTCACGILGYMNNTISLSSRVTVWRTNAECLSLSSAERRLSRCSFNETAAVLRFFERLGANHSSTWSKSRSRSAECPCVYFLFSLNGLRNPPLHMFSFSLVGLGLEKPSHSVGIWTSSSNDHTAHVFVNTSVNNWHVVFIVSPDSFHHEF